MAKMNPSQIDRSRPSSRLQPQSMLETTPVLFRLPSVQLQPLPPVADFPSESLLEFQAELPEVASSESTKDKSGEITEAKTDQQSGSWWEHWSSGVILIVLLIAAYVACVAVLRSRGKSRNTLATEAKESIDTNALKIPPITELSTTIAAADDLMNSLTTEPPSGREVKLEASAPTPLATAELLQPTQISQLPLLDSFQPASNNVNAVPVSSQLGQSPSLYDGSSNLQSSSQAAVSTSNLAEPALPEFSAMPLATDLSGNRPASNSFTLQGPTAPASSVGSAVGPGSTAGNTTPAYGQASNGMNNNSLAIPNLLQPSQTQSPVASTVSSTNSGNVPNLSGSATSGNNATGPSMRTTGTPESAGEVESIIRAYVELSRAGQIQSTSNANPNNRYQPPR